MNTRCWIMLVTLSFLWALSFVFNKIVVQQLPPSSIVMIRSVIAFITLITWMRWKKIPFNLRQNFRHYFVAGAFGFALPVTFIAWGQNFIGVSMTAVFNSTTPFFALVAAHYFTTDDKITVIRLLSILMGITGIIVLFGATGEAGSNPILGGSLVTLAVMFYGVNGVYIRNSMKHIDNVANCAGMMLTSFIILSPWVLWTNTDWPEFSLTLVLSLLSLGFFSSAIAFLLFFILVREAGVVNAVLTVMLIPIFATIMGVLFFQEVISVREWIGMSIILSGLVVADGRIFRKIKPRTSDIVAKCENIN